MRPVDDPDEVQLIGKRRKVALGDCGRAYGTGCVHEMACERCSLLRVDPAQRPRLVIILGSLAARVTEAREQSWLGELEGLQVSLATVRGKLQALDARTARQPAVTDLGMPSFPRTADRAASPDRLVQRSYRIWHLPAKLTAHARQRTLAISPDWPWAEAFLTCWRRLCALPAPA